MFNTRKIGLIRKTWSTKYFPVILVELPGASISTSKPEANKLPQLTLKDTKGSRENDC
jgi:hypothetical protein